MAIRFLKLRDPYGCFSNFWPCDIVYDGATWPSSEHLYQGFKYKGTDPVYRDLICRARTPRDAARLGRRGRNIRPNWDDVKTKAMEEAVKAKFIQHENIRRVLMSTGEEEIIEDFAGDGFWGIGDGTGQNMLGKILMKLRSDLSGMAFTQLSLI